MVRPQFENLTRYMKTFFKWVFRIVASISISFMVFLILFPVFVYYNYRRHIYIDKDAVQETDIAIVFGASAYGLDTPSPPLKDRLETAAYLYNNGKIKKILVSGDNSSQYYNEPIVMLNTLMKLGVKGADIIPDYAGFRTYDTCLRAKKIFGVNKALLISQGYHLPRAIFICDAIGIDATGIYSSGTFSTFYNRWYSIREILAMYSAFIDVFLVQPPVVLGKPEPIVIN